MVFAKECDISYYNKSSLDTDSVLDDDSDLHQILEQDQQHKANLVGSAHPGDQDRHSIVLDLDCEHEYKDSTTPGHGHLVIRSDLSWSDYRALLGHLYRCGVITEGYLHFCIMRKQSFVREHKPVPPVIKKNGPTYA